MQVKKQNKYQQVFGENSIYIKVSMSRKNIANQIWWKHYYVLKTMENEGTL